MRPFSIPAFAAAALTAAIVALSVPAFSQGTPQGGGGNANPTPGQSIVPAVPSPGSPPTSAPMSQGTGGGASSGTPAAPAAAATPGTPAAPATAAAAPMPERSELGKNPKTAAGEPLPLVLPSPLRTAKHDPKIAERDKTIIIDRKQ